MLCFSEKVSSAARVELVAYKTVRGPEVMKGAPDLSKLGRRGANIDKSPPDSN